jgi:hypothetical protein
MLALQTRRGDRRRVSRSPRYPARPHHSAILLPWLAFSGASRSRPAIPQRFDMSEKLLYRVMFVNQQQIYELYAKRVYQAELFGFVVIEDFVFGETSSIVIDPAEEKLRGEFENIKRSFVPMHEIIRIDQVERRGIAKIIPLDREAAATAKIAKFVYPDKA